MKRRETLTKRDYERFPVVYKSFSSKIFYWLLVGHFCKFVNWFYYELLVAQMLT